MLARVFEHFVSGDLTTMWRWLGTNEVGVDPVETYKILPSASTVREWLMNSLGRR